MAEGIIQVSDAEFDSKVLKSGVPVVVDFWAPWCGPCRAIAPVLEQLAGEYKGRVIVAKVNVDENPGSPSRYGVRGIPTLIAFKGGAAVDQQVGASGASQLRKLFDAVA